MQITLKAARVNAEKTIKQASKELGISHSTLIKWEKNPGLINPIWQNKISKVYDMDVDYIFLGARWILNPQNNINLYKNRR